MPLDGSAPRVTLGIATYNRDTYLREAVESCLRQDFEDLEVLVVLDGSTNPKIDGVLANLQDDPRLRVVRHERNRGIAEAYNTFVSEGRGELIAMLGDDDISLPNRIRRQVEIFDRYPDTGVVHGDAVVIDASGKRTGTWNSMDFTPAKLAQSFFRSHNYIVDPTRMVRRGVYDAVGGYDSRYPLANDFDFWLRAGRRFRFRHCPDGPLVAVRRHDQNTSHETAARARELDDVERALEAALEHYALRELIPELDWAVLDPEDAERQALLRLADALDQRALPVPGLAAKLRARATERSKHASGQPRRRTERPAGAPRKLMMTAYGWNDSGGGTTVPRLAAKELVRRGWEVTVFHAAVKPSPSGRPYEVLEFDEDGVHLIGVHNRPHGLFDFGNPLRELDDPAITLAFAAALDRTKPDVVHFHNLHNLGAALIDAAAARGLPAHFTTHNYWLICPRAYLLNSAGAICDGPGDGTRCASCAGGTGGADPATYQRRLAEIRARASAGLSSILAVSDAVRNTLMASGYPADLVDVVRQAMPHETEIWDRVGRERRPGRLGERLTVAFLGSAYPHKGPQLLVEAAQRTRAELKIRILGEVPDRFAAQLRALDRRGVVEIEGAFAPSEIGGLLENTDAVVLPSMWWDCAPLAAAEAKAARVPVVVPRLGGLPEAIRDEVDGLVFDALDAEDLARQLDRLALEPGLLERLQTAIEPPKAFAAYVDELEAYYAGERPGRVETPRTPDSLATRWQGDHGLPTSLSIINTRVSERLTGRLQRVKADGAPLDAPLPHLADVEVRHQWPPDLRPPAAGRLAVILPWEFGAVPREWLTEIERHVDGLWVPSEYVRRMYLDGGIDPERVQAIPNGVDLELFTPDGPKRDRPASGLRFLFVGGLIWRKGPDALLKAWLEAFAGREDVTLVVKDFGADGVYRGGDRDAIRAHVESGALPRIELIGEELTAEDLAALYRSCDVLVHPYRGEGFAMPVLEAMACGLPVIVTGGGPTDEFCPPEAGWRIASRRAAFPAAQLAPFQPAGRPWVLEPDHADLVRLLREAADQSAAERARRGAAGHAAAQAFSWDAVAARYDARIQALAARRPLLAGPDRAEAFPLVEDVSLRVLAKPAWRDQDRLGELLAAWTSATTRETSACLYLLSDPAADGEPHELEARVLAAAAQAGVDIDSGADINVLMEPFRADRDRRLHEAVDAYVPLHAGSAGHERLAREAGNPVIEPDSPELLALLARAGQATERAAA